MLPALPRVVGAPLCCTRAVAGTKLLRAPCGMLNVEPLWASHTQPLTGLAAGRVASSDRVAAELSGPGGAVITASVAERGRGVYTLFFTVDRAGVWALLPSVRPGAQSAAIYAMACHGYRAGSER
jgi:hypothetical protein